MKHVVVTLVAAVLALTASPAVADPEVGLSSDGVTFTETLTTPLFDTSLRWVPGDDRTATFYVRNQGPTGALMTITARSADTDELLANGDMVIRARADGGPWVELQNAVPSDQVLTDGIARGEVVDVDVNVVFDFASPNESQLDVLRARFDIGLRQDPNAPGVDGDADAGQEGSGLADTGGPASWTLLLAFVLLGTGVALAHSRLDDRRDESTETMDAHV